MFSTSVLECRKSLDPASTVLSPRAADEGSQESAGKLERSIRCSGPGLFPSDKENRPSVEQVTATPTKNSGALWMQLRQARRIEELQRRELDKLRQEARDQALKKSAGAAELEAKLEEQRREMLAERSRAAAEVAKLKADSKRMLQVLRGSEAVEKLAGLEELQRQLKDLSRWTAENEARVRKLQESRLRGNSKDYSKRLAFLEHRRLVSRVVHCAIVRASVQEGPNENELSTAPAMETEADAAEAHLQELEALRSELAAARAEAEAARAEETQRLEKICQEKVQHGIEVTSLRSEVASLEVQHGIEVTVLRSEVASLEAQCAEQQSSLQALDAAREDSERWRQRSQDRAEDFKDQLEKLRAAGPGPGPAPQQVEEGGARSCDFREDVLLAQSRELQLTVAMFKQECESLKAAKCSLQKTVASLEESLDDVSGQHAELAGHANHRQKIRHTLQLKTERDRLRDENLKLQQRICQLEASQSSRELINALAGLTGSRAGTPTSRGTPASRSTKAALAGSRRSSLRFGTLSEGGRGDEASPQAASEAERRCRQLECDLEYVNINFRHLMALVQSAVFGPEQSSTASLEANAVSLLQQLRILVEAKAAAEARK